MPQLTIHPLDINTMKTPCLLAIIGACILALNSGPLKASDLVTYQGKLTDAAAASLPDGQYWIGTRIWDTSSGGTIPLWSRKYQVPVAGGLFSLMLGSTGSPWETPPPLTSSLKLALSGTSRFVEITVMSDAGQPEKPEAQWKIMSPRQALGSVPYAMNGVPPGTVVPFAGTVIPDGWLICDGTILAISDPRYTTLCNTIGTAFNIGGESTGNIRLPDLRGRTAIGSGQGANLSNRVIAQKMGAETHALTIAQIPSHNHGGSTSTNGNHQHVSVGRDITTEGSPFGKSGNYSRVPAWPAIGTGAMYLTSPEGNHSHTISLEGGGQPHNIMQPSIVMNYIIKL